MKKSRKRRREEAEKERRKALLRKKQMLRNDNTELEKSKNSREEIRHRTLSFDVTLDREEILKISQYIFEQMRLRMEKTFLKNERKTIHTFEQSHVKASAWETEAEADKESYGKDDVPDLSDLLGKIEEIEPYLKEEDREYFPWSRPFGAGLLEEPEADEMTLNQKILRLIEPHILARGLTGKDLLKLAGSKADSLETEEFTEDRILLYAILLQMDVEVTGKLLAMAGFDFGKINRRNLILSYYLQTGVRDPKLVDQALAAFGDPLLGE